MSEKKEMTEYATGKEKRKGGRQKRTRKEIMKEQELGNKQKTKTSTYPYNAEVSELVPRVKTSFLIYLRYESAVSDRPQ